MLYRIQEYAANVGVHRKTVWLWMKENKLPKKAKVKEVAGVKFIEVKD